MKKLLIVIAVVVAQALCFGQGSAVVTFTGRDVNNHYVSPDSIVVENLTQQWTETMYWPDTVLTLTVGTGIGNLTMAGGIRVSPNPFDGTAQVEVPVAEAGEVRMQVTDMLGRVCAQYGGKLPAGNHQFRVTLEHPQVYVLTVCSGSQRWSAKLENAGRGSGDGIVYAGAADNVPGMLKLTPARPFQMGDEMRYSGYASEQRSQTVTRYQTTDETVQLVFIADGTPCPGSPTVTDIDGNVYNTVHIGDQCWMRENLRATRFENGDSIAYAGTIRSDSVAYRYAPNNDINNVNKYGYLYNGFAIMHGASSSNTIPSGVQGICPIGWHLPSQMEIFELREYVSKQNRYSCGGISTYIAKALSDTVGWHADEHFCSPGNDLTSNNATGFSALPAGSRFSWQYVYYGYTSRYWTCTYYYGYFSILFIHASNNTVAMGENESKDANSVRCLKD